MRKKKRPPHISQRDWDEVDIPELTEQDFRRMRPAREMLPKIFGPKMAAEMLRPRGRPRKENPKAQVTLRLDPEVLDHFKSGGAGWQTRINAALRRVVAKSR